MKTRVEGLKDHRVQRRSLIGGAALFVLAGCETVKKVNPDEWVPATMQGEPVKTAGGDGARRTRIVVLPSDENPSSPRGAALAARATAQVEQVLTAGGVEIVDRNLAGRLDKELKLAEMSGTGAYAGPDVADYVVRVKMGGARAESSYVQPTSNYDKKTGKTYTTPGGWTNSGKSSMSIEVRAVPSLKLLQTYQADGNVSDSQQPNRGNEIALVQAATDRGIQTKRSELLNHFSPKGYVLERRTKKDESIFRVQLGKNTGTKPGDTIEIWRTNSYGDEIQVGSGELTNLVGMEGSWIVVKDAKVAGQVKHGDYVKVKHGGIGDSILNLRNSLGL